MPPPQLSADQKALLREFQRFSQAHGPETFTSPVELAAAVGLGVGDAGAAIAGLFIKDLIILKEAQSGRLSKDGLMLAAELFDA